MRNSSGIVSSDKPVRCHLTVFLGGGIVQAMDTERPKVSAIAAIGKRRELGKDNKLIWKIPDDLRRLRALTIGHPVIMGRKTHDSLGGKTLPGREVLVVSKSGLSLQAALSQTAGAEEVMIAGGAEIFQQCLPLATHMVLSIIDGNYEGDVFFPEFDAKKWHLDKEEACQGFTVKYYTASS